MQDITGIPNVWIATNDITMLQQLPFPGTWGLFKFFEFGGGVGKKQPTGEYVLTYKVGGKTVTATIKPTGGDLFDRNIFTSARAPQTILK